MKQQNKARVAPALTWNADLTRLPAVASMIQAAGGRDNVAAFELGRGLHLFRRMDGRRWRDPVNGRRGYRTALFENTKNAGRLLHSESGGEIAMFAFFCVYPPIVKFVEQADLVTLSDEHGESWTVCDAFVELRCGSVAWVEGKHDQALVRGDGAVLPTVSQCLASSTQLKLRRFQKAFAAAGLSYVVVNESWCRHPIVSENVQYLFAHRHQALTEGERFSIQELLASGKRITIADCAVLFAEHPRPAEKVCAAVAQGHVEIDFEIPFSLGNIVTAPRPAFWLREIA
jgi:hypothetical protein